MDKKLVVRHAVRVVRFAGLGRSLTRMGTGKRKERGMFTKGRKNGTIRFSYSSQDGARKVCLAGSFSQWQPVTMRKQKNGSFAVTVEVPAGTHEYRFIVDGRWTTDPDNESYVPNPYGSANSIAQAA